MFAIGCKKCSLQASITVTASRAEVTVVHSSYKCKLVLRMFVQADWSFHLFVLALKVVL